MKTIDFEGQTFEYNESAADDWRFFRGTTCGRSDPQAFFVAMDVLFGDVDDVAARLDNSTTKVMTLFEAITDELGDEAKN